MSETPDKLPGTIQTFDAADRYGTLLLDDGRSVQFGRSACVGFEPFAGVRVGVGRVLRDASGAWAAEELTLSAHPVKDVSVPAVPAASPGATSPFAVDLSRGHFGWFSVLRDRPLPEDREALHALLEEPSLGKLRVVARPPTQQAPGRELELITGGQHLLALEVAAAPARERLDLRQVPSDFGLGTHRVGVAPGVADPLRLRMADPEGFPDPFGPTGQMRVASLIARRLLGEGGVGVVLHLAQDLVLSKDDFLRRLSQLEKPDCKPFGAWLDWVLSPDRRWYRSVGMHAFGVPDVEVEILNTTADVELDSAETALLFACMLQVRENRVLKQGEVLYVPKDLKVGPFGATAREKTGYKLTAEHHEAWIRLVRA